MQEQIGFDYQGIGSGNCGQKSLLHALLLCGITISEDEAHKMTGVPKWFTKIDGTSEDKIKKGLRKVGCIPQDYKYRNSTLAKEQIDSYLDNGVPVIVFISTIDHWCVLAHRNSKNKYYWIDSIEEDLYGFWNWEEIAAVMCDEIDCDKEGNPYEYYFIAVLPKNKNQLNHSIVKNFEDVYALFDDDELAEWWGYYLEDLNEIFNCPEGKKDIVDADTFFHHYGKMIYEKACYYYGDDVDEEQMMWEYENYKKVAHSHKLTVSLEKIPEAIASFSAALTCAAWNS